MGEQRVTQDLQGEQRRAFLKHLLADLRALEQMLAEGRIESDVRRIGAEQELVLVDKNHQPAPVALEVLDRLGSDDFTTELAKFNVEFNLAPLAFHGDCLRGMERQLEAAVRRVREAAGPVGADAILTGILPTLRKTHLNLDNMTPRPRYFALNDAITRLRGSDYELRFTGADELTVKHDSVMLESCNTGFQVHFQVSPEEFTRRYNIAQAAAAPVMAAAVNSPLLFGKRLWRETRISLFQQAVDTRTSGHHVDTRQARVSFGDRWVDSSVLEIFRDDIARLRVLLSIEITEDPLEVLAEGKVPELYALRLHNSTVYRWNRPCYGVCDGKAHLRIENRVLPAGPTVIDSVANAAFWLGLVNGMAREYGDVTAVMDFDDAKANFLAAARPGLRSQLVWMDQQPTPVRELICQRLL
ncbi:MAG: glutamate-cysteine ligase family protein, partial [Planctomycetota bacterium]